MQLGTYTNKHGITLNVTNPVMYVAEYATLGGIYEAELDDGLFGKKYYLVTEQTLRDLGYTRNYNQS